jgi:hypothetical protein
MTGYMVASEAPRSQLLDASYGRGEILVPGIDVLPGFLPHQRECGNGQGVIGMREADEAPLVAPLFPLYWRMGNELDRPERKQKATPPARLPSSRQGEK